MIVFRARRSSPSSASVIRRAFAFSLVLALPAGAQRRAVTAEDYFTFQLVSDPRIAPDGAHVAYTVARVDKMQNRRLPSIWTVPTDASARPKVLVGESWSPSAPRWSPDGAVIYFVSSRAASDTGANATRRAGAAPRAQLWAAPASGGVPRRITNLANGVSNCVIAPDGNRAACLVRTGPSDQLRPGSDRSDVRHYSQSSYKFNDTGWYDDRRSHIWIIDLATGAATQITNGDLWNDTDPQWSPDGSRIAFVSDRTGHEYDDAGRNPDVWVISTDGGSMLRLTTAPGPDNSPRWSPDGKSIAYVSSAGEEQPQQIMVVASTGGTPKTATDNLDLLPTDLQWIGQSLYFDTGVKGEYQVYRIDMPSRALMPVTSGARAVRSPSVAPNDRAIAFLVNDFTHLDEVYTATTGGGGETRLSGHNDSLLAQLALAPVERMTYRGADDWTIDGFLVKPINFDPSKKYPLILSIHGGPAGQYGVDWYHEFQVYASHGWAVFFANPRGSTGYGRKFARGIAGEWGGKDYIDIMNGVNATIATNAWIDTTRIGVTGGSYGGYMTNWIVGHSGRFRAAVTLRSISNFISDDGTRDGAYGHKDDFGGDIFQQYDLYWDRSPLKYVKSVTTPILILHSDNDYRVPIEQGEQWFRALRHYGKTAEIVFFPRENHNLTRTGEPKHLVESLDWQLYWFDRYLEGKQTVAPDRR